MARWSQRSQRTDQNPFSPKGLGSILCGSLFSPCFFVLSLLLFLHNNIVTLYLIIYLFNRLSNSIFKNVAADRPTDKRDDRFQFGVNGNYKVLRLFKMTQE